MLSVTMIVDLGAFLLFRLIVNQSLKETIQTPNSQPNERCACTLI